MEEIKEIESVEGRPEEINMGFKNKMILLAIFAVLLGFVIKTEAAKRITVGFEDYKLQGVEKTYNINQLQKDLEEKQAAQTKQQSAALESTVSEPGESAEGGAENTCPAGSGEDCNQ